MIRLRLRLDPFLVAIIATVGTATLLPARGEGAVAARWATDAAIVLLFFMHGAQLSPRAVLAGARNWRLHAIVLAATFVLFPALGVAAHTFVPGLLTPPLWAGVILVVAAPSTVQASIAFTSAAGGNVPAALCSASASNLLGIVLTPLIAGFLLTSHRADLSPRTILTVATQLLLPFLAGQLLRPAIGAFMARNTRALKLVDYGSILLIVYGAFSQGVVSGIWHQVDLPQIARLALVDAGLLATVIATLTLASRLLRFSRPDEIAIVFCGSKKSLASGLPIASVLLAGHPVGIVVLPLMVFHQIQLMVCAALATRYAASSASADAFSSASRLRLTQARSAEHPSPRVDALEELAMNQKRNFGQVARGCVKTPSARPVYDKAVGSTFRV
jgi:solute carrier family 10 (sodium/bile acid cotransporter), member 7